MSGIRLGGQARILSDGSKPYENTKWGSAAMRKLNQTWQKLRQAELGSAAKQEYLVIAQGHARILSEARRPCKGIRWVSAVTQEYWVRLGDQNQVEIR